MITPGLLAILALCALALMMGSCVRGWLLWREYRTVRAGDQAQQVARPAALRAAQQRLSSLRVWWLLLVLFSAALAAGVPGLSLLFCTTSLIGLQEFYSIFARHKPNSVVLLWLLCWLSMLHFALLLWLEPQKLLLATTGMLFLITVGHQLWVGNTADYLRTTGGYLWAGLVLIIGLSCGVALTSLPISTHRWNAGVVGWTLFVVLLTETSDISQALIGRQWGRHAVIRRVSPGKTWEGLAGGIIVTSLLALALSAPLTTLCEGRPSVTGAVLSLLSGVVICLAGFFGDINISAVKREAGLKDSSGLFPGMGGMLDRLDSLTCTAPALYGYAQIWNG